MKPSPSRFIGRVKSPFDIGAIRKMAKRVDALLNMQVPGGTVQYADGNVVVAPPAPAEPFIAFRITALGGKRFSIGPGIVEVRDYFNSVNATPLTGPTDPPTYQQFLYHQSDLQFSISVLGSGETQTDARVSNPILDLSAESTDDNYDIFLKVIGTDDPVMALSVSFEYAVAGTVPSYQQHDPHEITTRYLIGTVNIGSSEPVGTNGILQNVTANLVGQFCNNNIARATNYVDYRVYFPNDYVKRGSSGPGIAGSGVWVMNTTTRAGETFSGSPYCHLGLDPYSPGADVSLTNLFTKVHDNPTA